MLVSKEPHERHYYFAQQFASLDADDVGYIGLQPRPDNGSAAVIHAVFSSFVRELADDYPKHGHMRADSEDLHDGVSSAVDFKGNYGHWYDMVVENVHGTTWNGTAVGAQIGEGIPIDSYTIPPGASGSKYKQTGFMGYYAGPAAKPGTKLPYTDVTFGYPSTKTTADGLAMRRKKALQSDNIPKCFS
ncbi:hypothetical protein BBP40_003337 [Aspergillus hancockii]|nr:hypothetical protein BBP40_003337 [Aspergillus hancockii]